MGGRERERVPDCVDAVVFFGAVQVGAENVTTAISLVKFEKNVSVSTPRTLPLSLSLSLSRLPSGAKASLFNLEPTSPRMSHHPYIPSFG